MVCGKVQKVIDILVSGEITRLMAMVFIFGSTATNTKANLSNS